MAGESTADAAQPDEGRPAGETGGEGDAPVDSSPCPPCRGTGSVVSNLGGTPKTVACPWCEGRGVFLPGHDAQAARREAADEKAEKVAESEE